MIYRNLHCQGRFNDTGIALPQQVSTQFRQLGVYLAQAVKVVLCVLRRCNRMQLVKEALCVSRDAKQTVGRRISMQIEGLLVEEIL